MNKLVRAVFRWLIEFYFARKSDKEFLIFLAKRYNFQIIFAPEQYEQIVENDFDPSVLSSLGPPFNNSGTTKTCARFIRLFISFLRLPIVIDSFSNHSERRRFRSGKLFAECGARAYDLVHDTKFSINSRQGVANALNSWFDSLSHPKFLGNSKSEIAFRIKELTHRLPNLDPKRFDKLPHALKMQHVDELVVIILEVLDLFRKQ